MYLRMPNLMTAVPYYTNILFLSKAISIYGLRSPFFGDHYVSGIQWYIPWLGAPEIIRISIGISQIFMLFLMEGFTISGLRRHLGFEHRSMTTHLHTRATTMNKTRIWYQNLRVLDGCRTFLRLIISVHFRNNTIRQLYCTSGKDWHPETMPIPIAYSDQVPMKTWKQSIKMSVVANREI